MSETSVKEGKHVVANLSHSRAFKDVKKTDFWPTLLPGAF